MSGKFGTGLFRRLTDFEHLKSELSKRYRDRLSKSKRSENLSLLKTYAQQEAPAPPIFVVAPPRSGSTLFYQLMVHRFKFAYFQNQMAFYRFAIPWYVKNKLDVFKPYISDFESKLGKTSQDVGPNGALFFWDRFFPKKENEYFETLSLSSEEEFELKQTIHFLSTYFNQPFFSKNLKLALALKPIQKLFPHAIFITIKRDPRSIASSILDARLKAHGTKEKWRLMQPKCYPEVLKKPPHLQIGNQVSDIYQVLSEEFYPDSKVISVQYESFCQNPEKAMREVEIKLAEFGINLESRNEEIPKEFKFKKTVLFSDKEVEDLNNWFEKAGTFNYAPKVLDL